MKVPIIKKLVEEVELEKLIKAEEDLCEEKPLEIEVEGSDDGERLTHIMAAIWIKQDMQKSNTDLRTSLRNYTVKVRKSIS